MSTEVVTAIISAISLVIVSIVGGTATILSRRLGHAVRDVAVKVDTGSFEISKHIDDTARIRFVPGITESLDMLTQLTLNESRQVKVTRFSPKAVQREERYFSAVEARIRGGRFEGKDYPSLERYFRLTSLNSPENKESLIEQVERFKDCRNLVLKVSADKNDFELLLFESSGRVAFGESKPAVAFGFHDLEAREVLHSCIVSNDEQLFRKMSDLYRKLWSEDIILEIDFSLGEDHINQKLEMLKSLKPIEKPDLPR